MGNVGLVYFEADVVLVEAGTPAAVAGLEDESDQRGPVVKMLCLGRRRFVLVRAQSDGRCPAVVAGHMRVARGEGGELGEQRRRGRFEGAREAAAYDLFQRAFEARANDGVEGRVVELDGIEWDELAPLIARSEHAR